MSRVALIGVPFDGYGRPGNQARAAAVLRTAGLVDAFVGHDVDADNDLDLDLPAPDPRRGADTSLVNEPALLAMTALLESRVGGAVRGGRFPVVFGADCSTLLGTVAGLRTVDGARLLFVDGHEDTMPLDTSEDGEAANTEIGLLLGLTGRLLRGPLADGLPALTKDALTVLGPRDEAWRRRFNVGSLREHGVWLRTGDEAAADPAGLAVEAVRHLAGPWWLHVDLDVLDPTVFGAQGLPDSPDEPGGLTWPQLTDLLVAAVEHGGCLGWSIAIYDPDQDPAGDDARRIVQLVRDVAAALP